MFVCMFVRVWVCVSTKNPGGGVRICIFGVNALDLLVMGSGLYRQPLLT